MVENENKEIPDLEKEEISDSAPKKENISKKFGKFATTVALGASLMGQHAEASEQNRNPITKLPDKNAHTTRYEGKSIKDMSFEKFAKQDFKKNDIIEFKIDKNFEKHRVYEVKERNGYQVIFSDLSVQSVPYWNRMSLAYKGKIIDSQLFKVRNYDAQSTKFNWDFDENKPNQLIKVNIIISPLNFNKNHTDPIQEIKLVPNQKTIEYK